MALVSEHVAALVSKVLVEVLYAYRQIALAWLLIGCQGS